jgi:hypothetical protein
MATFSKITGSGSTDGRLVKVAATATPGTTLHTGSATTTTYDEIWIEAFNSHSAAVDLTIEFGGVTDPDDLIRITLPAASAGNYVGPSRVIEGWPLKGNATPLVVRAFASSANKIVCNIFANRIAA